MGLLTLSDYLSIVQLFAIAVGDVTWIVFDISALNVSKIIVANDETDNIEKTFEHVHPSTMELFPQKGNYHSTYTLAWEKFIFIMFIL